MIDRTTVQRIIDAADIVDVVKEFVSLRKAGVNYKGLCPFHNEKTPSFVVSPSKQLFKCFSCGKGGNAVHFIMEHEQMNYPEALRFLARKYGITIEEKELTDQERAAATQRDSMMVVNEWARDYFTNILWNHADGQAIGMAYLRQRGFRDDIIKKFQLGFCLSGRDEMCKAAQSKGLKAEFLVKTGLCYETNNGILADRYHGRVIFPVHTISGRIVAFGGRVLETNAKVAKYVNSPESEIYHKSHELYGLYFAKHSIAKEGCCYLVEGYTDVISMNQSGIENVVASSGTSLTEGQIRLIHRFTENVTVLYDGDNAGIKASLRGIDMLLAEGLNIKVLLLPDGDDPDSFARKHSAQEYKEYITKHQVDFIKFKTNMLLKDCENDPIKRAGLVSAIVESIAIIPNAIVRQMYIKECAANLLVDESLLINEINKFKQQNNSNSKSIPQTAKEGESNIKAANNEVQSTPTTQVNRNEVEEERLLSRLIIRYGEQSLGEYQDKEGDLKSVSVIEYIHQDLSADGLTFQTPIYNEILNEAIKHYKDTNFIAKDFFQYHPNPKVSKVAANLLEEPYQLSTYHSKYKKIKDDSERLTELVPRLICDFKYSIIVSEMKDILLKLRSPELQNDLEQCEILMKRYMTLKNIERQLAQQLGVRVLSCL